MTDPMTSFDSIGYAPSAQGLRPAASTSRNAHSSMTNPHLLLMATCCLGHWTLEQVLETYALTEPACILLLAELDRLRLIELKPLNRYRLRVSNAFHWLPDGPVQQFFREHVVSDYFGGDFNGAGETLLFLPARLSQPSAQELVARIQQLAGELARLHQGDRKLPPQERDGFSLLVGFRSWEYAAFTALRRK